MVSKINCDNETKDIIYDLSTITRSHMSFHAFFLDKASLMQFPKITS